MKSRHASVSRHLNLAFLTVILLASVITFGWAALSTPPAPEFPTRASAPISRLSPAAQRAYARLTSPTRSNVIAANQLTPHLVNLTNSAATKERYPAWSPQGNLIAFISNGLDTDKDGVIETLNTDPNQFGLYTMELDGTAMTLYDTQGSVGGLVWRTNGTLVYVTQKEGTQYTIRSVDISTKTVSAPLFTTPNKLEALTISANNLILYFEMKVGATWNIYQIPATGLSSGAVPIQLTTTGNNRHPFFATLNSLVTILYDSDSSGRKAIWAMSAGGANPLQLTNPAAQDEDTQPQLTNDGQYLVFVSNRLTTPFSATADTTRNTNIWVGSFPKNTPSGTILPVDTTTLAPRFNIEAAQTSNQIDPAVQVLSGYPTEMLFVSDNTQPGSEDIFLGSAVDTEAPYVTAPPTANPKIVVPTKPVTISVPVQDLDTGVRHVWVQIKDPDMANQDLQGQNHVLVQSVNDWRTDLNYDGDALFGPDPIPDQRIDNAASMLPWAWKDVQSPMAVEFQPLDWRTNTYIPIEQIGSGGSYSSAGKQSASKGPNKAPILRNLPDYYAFATSNNSSSVFSSIYGSYSAEGEGYPEVPSHWLEMYDDGTHGDAVANDGTYTSNQWITPPSTMEGDWYFDIIVEDKCDVAKDSSGNWHGYRRRFDNIGGCTTVAYFTGGHNVLFVDEYGDGQRFMFYGVGGSQPQYFGPCMLETPYYFMPQPVNPVTASMSALPIPSPLAPNGEFGGADIWRILCRGPVPDDILASYTPNQVTEVDGADGVTPIQVRHGDKEVVWHSPSSWYRLFTSWSSDAPYTGTGSLLELSVQDQLKKFVSQGGRLFTVGFDLPTGLTNDNTLPSTFMQEVLGASMDQSDIAKGIYLDERWDTPAPGNGLRKVPLAPHSAFFPGNTQPAPGRDIDAVGLFAVPNWYGGDLPVIVTDKRWPTGSYMKPHGYLPNYDSHTGRNNPHDHWVLPSNDNPSFFNDSNDVRPFLTYTWDILKPMSLVDPKFTYSRASYALWDVVWFGIGPDGKKQELTDAKWHGGYDSYTLSPFVTGVSNEYGDNGRTVLWSFGLGQLSARYRNRPLASTIEWLLDGSITGTVAQNNDLKPIVNALVIVSQGQRLYGAYHTDGRGKYELKGLRPGWYHLHVVANGYFGTMDKDVPVDGGRITDDQRTSDVNFFLYRNPNTSTLWGYVTLHGLPVGNAKATVVATPIGGTGSFTTTTDDAGRYELTNLPTGPYLLTATHVDTKVSVTLRIDNINPGERLRQDIELAVYKPDMLIKAAADTAFTGDNIYNADADQQTITQIVQSNATATYPLEIQNDGNFSDTFTLTGPAGGNGWTVRYFDASTAGNDITAQITGNGWSTGLMAGGSMKALRVEVTPDATVAESTAKDLQIRAVSASDSTAVDVVQASTEKAGPLKSVLLTANPASPQKVHTPITLIARASGGTGNVYQFTVNGTLLRDYTASSTCAWTPSIGGTYNLAVNVKDLNGTDPTAIVTGTLTFQVTALPLTGVTLDANPPSPQYTNTKIRLTATPIEGSNPVFKFMAGTTVLRDFDPSPNYDWTPTVAATYSLTAVVEELGETDPAKVYTSIPLLYQINIPPLTKATLTVTPSSPRTIGATINMSVATDGGSNNAYQFMSGATVLRAYGPTSTFNWVPATNGTNQLKVLVRDLGSANPTLDVPSNTVPYVITKPLTTAALTASPASPQMMNTPITLTATATVGANVQYKFMANTTVIRNFSASNTCSWTPTTAGTFSLTVVTQDLNGVNPNNLVTSPVLTYTVLTPLSNNLTLTVSPLSPAVVSTPITMTAASTGGADVVYQFLINGSPAGIFDPAKVNVWTPTTAGTYTLQVVAKDLGGTDPTLQVLSNIITYTVKNALSKLVLSASPNSPCAVGARIALTATATGGANLEYLFTANGTTVQAYSAANTCTWAPTQPGTYRLVATARDRNSANPTAEVASTQLTYIITAALASTQLIATPPSPGTVNARISLSATTVGGASLLYQFRVGTTVIRDYSTDPTCTWIPSAQGTYQLTVRAKDQGGANPNLEVISPVVSYIIKPLLSGVTLTANPAAVCVVNSSVTLTGTPNGGGAVQYKFMSGSTILRDYSSTATLIWKPTTVGTYTLTVVAKDTGSTNPTQEFTSPAVTYTVKAALNGVSLTTNPSSPCATNTKVTLTANVSGGANPYFTFKVNGTVIGQETSSPTCLWTPTQPGYYSLSVSVRDQGGVDVTKSMITSPLSYVVIDPLSSVTLTTDLASPQAVNTIIGLRATSIGGANVEYRFLIGTTLLQDFGPSNTCTWKPTVPGTYTLRVAARDRNGADPLKEVPSSSITFVVNPTGTQPFGVQLTANPMNAAALTHVTLTATATGATNVQYRFREGYQDRWGRWRWTDLQLYSATNTCLWIPANPRAYTMVVWARRASSTKSYDAFAQLRYKAVSAAQ